MIKIDMKLPKTCTTCPIADYFIKATFCRVRQRFMRGKSKRPKDCPLRK